MGRLVRTLLLAAALLGAAAPAPAAAAAAMPSITEFSAGITPGSGPTDIVAGPDGNLWFTQTYAGKIGRITPAGVVTEFSTGIVPGSEPDQIAAGPDGNLWFTHHNRKSVGRITPTGVVTEIPLDFIAYGITAGPDGRMWVTGGQAAWTPGAVVGAIAMDGSVYRRHAYLSMTYPYESGGIATGPSGDLWFLQTMLNDLGRVTTNGTLTSWPMWQHGFTPGMMAKNLVLGPDGNMWMTELSGAIARVTDAGQVTEFQVEHGVVTIPQDIAAGPDGNLWFTAIGLNAIGRITPSGTITKTTAGVTAGGRLWGITAGPDGNLWYAQQGADKIGRVNLVTPSTPTPPSTPSTPPPVTPPATPPATPVTPVVPVKPVVPAPELLVAQPAGEERTPAAAPTAPAGSKATPTPTPAPAPRGGATSPASCPARAVTVRWSLPKGQRLRALTLTPTGGKPVRAGARARTARVKLPAAATATIRLSATTRRGTRLRATVAVSGCGTRVPVAQLRR